ncbi:MAG TPA: methyl-accepting chemotaxis protein [Candidatus Deferrimicrobiaceae bacterium]|jgi:methyl-accepting chemotaxis protein
MFARSKLSVRIFSQAVVLVLCFALVLAWIYPTIRRVLYEDRRTKTRHLVEVGYGVAASFAKQAKDGALTEEEAKKRSLDVIRTLRYEKSDYFWINDMKPAMVMHPFKPELDGKDLSEFKDPNGKRLFVAFVDKVKADGAGFVDYLWPKPDSRDPVEKISYVKALPEWGWVIGSGVYIDDIKAELNRLLLMLYGVVALIVAAGVGVSLWLSRSLAGALSASVEELDSGVSHLLSTSSSISSVSASLADASASQASSLEETASAMEEMSAMTRQNAENAGLAKTLADGMGASVEKANGSMVSMVTAMEQISLRSEEIGKIIKTIDEIAFQTNLLALNAAVEAARAGEAGAGFAVVAGEVRNLSQRAAEAAKNTSELIESTLMVVSAGTMLVEETNTDFGDVASAVRKVTELVAEISAATSEQSRGIAEVSKAVSEIDKITQQTAASSQEVASSSEELGSYAEQVQSVVDRLNLMVEGEQGGDAGRRPPGPLALR